MKKIVVLGLAVLLTACGGGGGDSNGGGTSGGDSGGSSSGGTTSTTMNISGSGVKGPLVGAIVRAYAIDPANLMSEGTLLATGETNTEANIAGLAIPADTTGLIRLVFTADDDTIDLTTGQAPTLTELVTVVPAAQISAGMPIYATPLTTVAVSLATANADMSGVYGGDRDGVVSETELVAALATAGAQVANTLGFGLLDSSMDIFTTPPVLTDITDTAAEQEAVLRYRTAVEAFSAVIDALMMDAITQNASTTLTTDDALQALADDLTDGVIDGMQASTPLPTFADTSDLATIVTQDPTTLTVPGTDIPITDLDAVIAEEVGTTGTTVVVVSIPDLTPTPAVVSSDIDADTIADAIDICPSIPNTDQSDIDSDGVGDACELAIWDEFSFAGALWQ